MNQNHFDQALIKLHQCHLEIADKNREIYESNKHLMILKLATMGYTPSDALLEVISEL